MKTEITSLETLKSRADDVRGRKWMPGYVSRHLKRNANWSALIEEDSLMVFGRMYPIDAIDSVSTYRGVVWCRVEVEHEDGTIMVLGGLRNRVAKKFVDSIQANCVIRSLERLNSLVEIADEQREKWLRLLAQRHWLAQSEVQRFIDACPANRPESDLKGFISRQYTSQAMNYIEPERLSLLGFLDGRDLSELTRIRNKEFLAKELDLYRTFFDTVEKNPLTDEQRRAVVTIDDNVMTVAAAGSGKTSVMVAKAGYAVEAELFKPEAILLLAFNRKAAEELAERVRDLLGKRIQNANRIKIGTFHSLGLSIIAQATGETPNVAPYIVQGKELAELSDIINELTENQEFSEKWNMFKTVFFRSLPPFGAEEEPEWWDRDTGRRGFLTLRGETVKSQEERMICDWLADKGINYEYERPYEHDTATDTKRQYMPDFYYPSVGAYHEHFALDEHGKPPPHFEGYTEGVRWKRKLHAEYETTLIETTSHGIRSEGGFQKLAQDLKNCGVRFNEIPLTDEQMKRMSDIGSILSVFRTFLSHVKSNRLNMTQLREKAQLTESGHPDRDQLFLDLFEKIWEGWEQRLARGNYVDFDDMLGRAVDYLTDGYCEMPYQLVMADEFQDTSRVRGALLRELTKAEDARLFVVGDDWQAVNRFAGADISLMRDFKKYFGNSTVVQLTKTFRCPQDLCDIAGKFVMANPYQIQKTVTSTNTREPPSVICFMLEDIDGQESLLQKHIGDLAKKIREQGQSGRFSAYILGRNNFNRPANLSKIRMEVSDVLDIGFSTVHAAKGLEADYVFLMSVVEATYGFPNKIEDDSTLWIAMPQSEEFPFSEERRLFYVALTRAKRLVTIYTEAKTRSEFISEILRQNETIEVRGKNISVKAHLNCPQCETGILLRRKGKFGYFLGCDRFPRCDYTEKIKKDH